jgi:two-component system, LytTR family, sensor kinase
LFRTIPDKTIPLQEAVDESVVRFGRFSYYRWFYHVLFWIIYYLFICLVFYSAYDIHDLGFYTRVFAFMPISAALVYFNVYILIPAFFRRRKYLYYTASLAIAILIAALADQLLKKFFAGHGSPIFAYSSGLNVKSLFTESVALFYLTGFTTSVKLSIDWIQNQQLMKEKEKHYLETELNFLKSQIQPHFFFNTLNNLYSLTLKKSDQAPDVVLKLSALMSYMLYESNATKVPLSKEISYLQNYLDLEKLRFGQRLDISFDMEGPIEEVKIPPMILILFIENSFKHGIKNNVHKIRIEIDLKVAGDSLFFKVKNPLGERILQGKTTGIGLKNAARRLELLYGNQYQLEYSQSENDFVASLKIPAC